MGLAGPADGSGRHPVRGGRTSLTIRESDLGKPASILASTSPVLGLPDMGLLLAAALICGVIFFSTWSKEDN